MLHKWRNKKWQVKMSTISAEQTDRQTYEINKGQKKKKGNEYVITFKNLMLKNAMIPISYFLR